MIIALTGYMASGKSHVGKELGMLLGYPFVDLDKAIEQEAGMTVAEIFDAVGEKGFREAERICLAEKVSEADGLGIIIALGGGTIIQEEAQEVLKDCTKVYLRTKEETIRRRLGSKTEDRPMLQLHNIGELLKRRIPVYEGTADVIVDTDEGTPLEIAESICKALGLVSREDSDGSGGERDGDGSERDGDGERFGLIGWPISKSQSPMIFKAAYGGKWPYDLIESEDFEECWRRFLEGYKAINVTAPFKELAIKRADIIHPECLAIGATNLVVKTKDGLEAYNSDYLAIKSIIMEQVLGSGDGDEATETVPAGNGAKGVEAEEVAEAVEAEEAVKRAVIAGYGGAGKAAAVAARDCGMEVVVCNRTTDKCNDLHPLEELASLASRADILIYTLPCSIPGIENLECPCVLEANYKNPALENCKGIQNYINGSEWLIRQAVLGYKFLTGKEPDSEAIRELYK